MKWRQGHSQRGSPACDKAGQESPSPLVLTPLCPGAGEDVHAPSPMDTGVGDHSCCLQGHAVGTHRDPVALVSLQLQQTSLSCLHSPCAHLITAGPWQALVWPQPELPSGCETPGWSQ